MNGPANAKRWDAVGNGVVRTFLGVHSISPTRGRFAVPWAPCLLPTLVWGQGKAGCRGAGTEKRLGRFKEVAD